jgi:hypothetical protein
MSADAIDRLRQIREREAASTKGPWLPKTYTNYDGFSLHAEGFGCVVERWESTPDEGRLREIRANGAFVQHAREDVPYLLSLLTAAQERERRDGERWAKVGPLVEFILARTGPCVGMLRIIPDLFAGRTVSDAEDARLTELLKACHASATESVVRGGEVSTPPSGAEQPASAGDPSFRDRAAPLLELLSRIDRADNRWLTDGLRKKLADLLSGEEVRDG